MSAALTFVSLPEFPGLLMIVPIAVISYFWAPWRDVPLLRWTLLVLWVPAALIASVAYELHGNGHAVADTLRLFARRDPTTVRLLFHLPVDGFVATFAVMVGGAVAACGVLALQLAGSVLGIVFSLTPRAGGGRA